MSKILTDEERQALLAKEEEERLAKEKEKAQATGYVLQVRYDKLKLQRAIEAQKIIYDAIVKPFRPKDRKDFPETLSKMAYCAEIGERTTEKKNRYFSIDLTKPENKDLEEDLKEIDMTEDQFATLALCACGNDIEKFVAKFNNEAEEEIRADAGFEPLGRKASKVNYDKIRDEGILKARAAISEYRSGDPKAYAKLLGNALLLSCTGFAREPSDDVAMQWSLYTHDILSQFYEKPQLAKYCGLTKKHFELAEKVAEMGRTINGGLKAAEKLSSVKFTLDGTIKNPEQIEAISESVLKFKAVARNREALLDEIMTLHTESKPLQKECL